MATVAKCKKLTKWTVPPGVRVKSANTVGFSTAAGAQLVRVSL